MVLSCMIFAILDPTKQLVAKVDILLFLIWGISSLFYGLHFMIALLYLQLIGAIMIVFHLAVASLIPHEGFWYEHGFD